MAAPKWVTLRAQWLGQHLRELREANDLLLRDAAEYLQRDPGTVSRFESGGYPIRRPDLLALLDLYGVANGRRREELVKLSQDVWQKGWWDGYADEVGGHFIDYVWLESRAQEIRAFDNTLLPGLLQTVEYARACITAAELDAGAEQIDRWVQLRMHRQTVLHANDPPRLGFIIDEAALHRQVGGRECMAAQLHRLAEHAGQPNIELRVLPFSAGAHASPSGAFRVFGMTAPFPEVGYAETPKGAIYLESPDSQRLVRTYDELRNRALSPDESARLITALAEELL
ncbi:transcriptional regulator [Sphaerisporangium melleum]|uniref:Transcriptional regulator n=1 Tax=Sphaerisporangium melleum TaxID=321316 RepID=A0A917R322_9ACTN|nr:helix-turn-helix transcriptional regulator [Sphaerisporangium melleum]GGK85232.1 transcriptional regulator [Sphaerisporangium melleum]GII70515.1 transcriptional regulator [Sphaerisporangium melleum]